MSIPFVVDSDSTPEPNFSFDPSVAEPEREQTVSLPPKIAKWSALTTFGALVVLPIFFGGVHPSVYWFSICLGLSLLAVLSFAAPQTITAVVTGSKNRPLYYCILALTSLLAYTLAQAAWLGMKNNAHPILGYATGQLNSEAFWSASAQILCVIATLIGVSVWLASSERNETRLQKWILLAGALVSGIALVHWLSDNGKLFWIFSPDHLFQSTRARWPFVNANHLGHFLIPIFFLTLARLANQISALADLRVSRSTGRKRTLATILQSDRLEAKIIPVAVSSIVLLMILLAIAGTLSRSTWIGLTIGLIVFGILDHLAQLKIKAAETQPNQIDINSVQKKARGSGATIVDIEEVRSHRSHRPRRKKNEWAVYLWNLAPKLVKPGLFIFAICAFLFFLNERGSELLVDRLEYGLTASKDDIRWQMYDDTLNIFNAHPFFGIGLGAWSELYPKYMSPLLSGVNPVYLHSDLLQLLTEVGLAGILPLCILAAYLVYLGATRFSSASRRDRRIGFGIISGVLALLVASAFDFPFRVPAITCLVTILLALYCHKLSQTSS